MIFNLFSLHDKEAIDFFFYAHVFGKHQRWMLKVSLVRISLTLWGKYFNYSLRSISRIQKTIFQNVTCYYEAHVFANSLNHKHVDITPPLKTFTVTFSNAFSSLITNVKKIINNNYNFWNYLCLSLYKFAFATSLQSKSTQICHLVFGVTTQIKI